MMIKILYSPFEMSCFRHLLPTKLTFCQLRALRKLQKSFARYYSGAPLGPDSATDYDNSTSAAHVPVMLREVVSLLKPQNGQLIVDMTFGGGGHTREIIQQAPDVRILALDRDPVAHQVAEELADSCSKGQVTPLLGCFSDLPELLSSQGIDESSVDAFLFDLGASSMQFDQSERGFSLSRDGPLDMRMNSNSNQPTAADVVNTLDESDLYIILRKYGEEKLARKISHAIVETRSAFGNITRTKQLADIVSTVFTGDHRQDKMMRHAHVATKTFQALRIFVNNEMNELNNGLEVAHHYLRPGGICVALSFHSLEDRIVKRHFHGIEMDAKLNMTVRDHHHNPSLVHNRSEVEEILQQRWRPVSKKVSVPDFDETFENPRSRSAKLRAAIKV